MEPRLKLHTNLLVEIRDAKTGEIIELVDQPNKIVLAGRNLVRDLLRGTSSEDISHMALGTGTTAVTSTDTTLDTEVFRGAMTSFTDTDGQTVFKYFLASGSANGNTLAEAGLFTAGSGGTMYARSVLSSTIVKTSSITATFTWTCTYSE